MVVHARGATRGAFQVSALDPSCDRDNRPVTTFTLDTLVTQRSLELSPLHQIPVSYQSSRIQSSVKKQSATMM